jgi:hypothetical protein
MTLTFDFGLDHLVPGVYIYGDLALQIVGGLKYLLKSPASHKR